MDNLFANRRFTEEKPLGTDLLVRLTDVSERFTDVSEHQLDVLERFTDIRERFTDVSDYHVAIIDRGSVVTDHAAGENLLSPAVLVPTAAQSRLAPTPSAVHLPDRHDALAVWEEIRRVRRQLST